MHIKILQRGTESSQCFQSTKDLGQTTNLSLDRHWGWCFSVQEKEGPVGVAFASSFHPTSNLQKDLMLQGEELDCQPRVLLCSHMEMKTVF